MNSTKKERDPTTARTVQEVHFTSRTPPGPIHQRLHLVLCDTHAPVFWESEPPATFAHTPLAKSSRETLTTITRIILKLHVGLTMSMYPKCSLRVVRLGAIVPRKETF